MNIKTFISTINRQFDESYFGRGAGHGATLRVKQPNEYSIRTGRVMDVQDQSEVASTITVASQYGVDMRLNSAELSMSNDGFDQFSKDKIEPAAARLISTVESIVLQGATKKVANLVGTAGTVPGASGDTSMIGAARARLNQFLAPSADRSLQIDSTTMASIVNGNKAIFHEGSQVKTAFTEGYYSRGAGFDWYENERTLSLTNGSDISGTWGSQMADGAATVTAGSVSFKEGQVYTGGATTNIVYAVHPETKATYPFQRQFVATADGTTTLGFWPPARLAGPKQNVNVIPVNGEAIVFFGNASTSYRNALAYHKDFCAFVSADLPMMADAASCTVRNQDGIGVRVWQGSDIRNDELLMRIDILFGWEVLRPDWACRINCT